MIKTMFAAAGFFSGLQLCGASAEAQDYPNPEFNNEVCALRKDSNRLTRLEKQTAVVENKMTLGGMGGSRMEYNVETGRSSVRFGNMDQTTFVLWTGGNGSSAAQNNRSDSMMKANGIDPNMLSGFGTMNPGQVTLYKMESSKDKRTVTLAKNGGMAFAKKSSSSDTYSTSSRKIRDGYFELVVDKKLPKGEYAFVIKSMGMDAMKGGATLFCFGVD